MSRAVWAAALPALCFLAWCVLASGARAESIRQVYLVQNSGWMEPFYTDPASQFRPLVTALVTATRLEDESLAVAAFNQSGQVAGRASPQLLYEGAYAEDRVRTALDQKLDLPRKTGSSSYTDADFNGALIGAIERLLQGREGVIWMITNNKNSPSNDQNVQENTQRFYAHLRESTAITRIVAFPVRMAVRGPKFSEGGFLIYGIGYGERGGRALDVIVGENAPVRGLFTAPPVNLKPVQEAPVTLRFEGAETREGLRAGVEQGVLVVSGGDAAAGATLRLKGRLHNTFYPHRITSAQIELTWAEIGDGAAGAARAAVTPDRVENLPPLQDGDPLTVELTIPPVARPPGLAGLFASERTVDGTLSVRLKDLRLDLDPDFLTRIQPIFGGSLLGGAPRTIESQMPDIFFDFRQINATTTTVPVRIEVGYSSWPLIGLAAAGLLLAAAAAGGTYALTAARTQKVMLGPYPRQVRLRAFRAETMRAPDGSQWRVHRGLFGTPHVARLSETERGAATPRPDRRS